MKTSEAKDQMELFQFTIEPFVADGFLLTIKNSGDCHHKIRSARTSFFESILALCNSMSDEIECFSRRSNGNDFCDLIAHIMRDDRGLA